MLRIPPDGVWPPVKGEWIEALDEETGEPVWQRWAVRGGRRRLMEQRSQAGTPEKPTD